MTIIAIDLTLIEFIIVPLVAIIFGATVYFFIRSRKTLQQTLHAGRKKVSITPKIEKTPSFQRSSIVELEEQFAKKRYEASVPKQQQPEVYSKKPLVRDENSVQDLKNTIAQQQKMLENYLEKVEELENEGREELNEKIGELEKQVDQLYGVIEQKDEEIKELQQEVSAGQRMAAKIEEVYQEFEQLQTKMAALEKQAHRANNLAIELEDAKFSYEQIHKELTRKQDKLEEVLEENQRMRQDMNELEDKLSEANLQRQQLQKKVLFLTDLNNDMQSIADTNKKLQTELRRIGELESMLNMMAEERDFLLRKKKDR
jgi:chromosome segregation ATPase